MKLLDALVTFAEDNTGEDKWKSEALSGVKLRVWVLGDGSRDWLYRFAL